MTEILEKGLVIGFSLLIMISFLSFISPMMNVIFYNEKMQNFNQFCILFENSFSKVESSLEPYELNYYLIEEIRISINRIENKSYIFINSDIKNYTFSNRNDIIPNSLILYQNISLLFEYSGDIIVIKNVMEGY
ncbi:MAG: hypothetical protein ACTSRZ_00340 [Promethearchaeota archaeon]